MRLSPAQVTLLREAEHQFLGNVASRGTNYHIAMEDFMHEALKIVMPELKWKDDHWEVPVDIARQQGR